MYRHFSIVVNVLVDFLEAASLGIASDGSEELGMAVQELRDGPE